MSYQVAIRKNSDGEVRLCTVDSDWEEILEWEWTENDYGCDCNREIFFERSGGKVYEEIETECSEGRFSALYAELPDGTRITLDKQHETQEVNHEQQT